MRVAAVVPVIDEAAAIGWVVEGLRACGACCIFVVDGDSQDGTREVARAAGGILVDEPRRGYGRACLTGAEHAMAAAPGDGHTHDAVAFLDGDGSCDPADLPRLVEALAVVDVALGRRPGSRIVPGAMPWHARLGNALVAALTSARLGRTVRDLPPFKVLRTPALASLGLDDERYGWTVQLVARALADRQLAIREVPVAFRDRRGGVSKVSGSWRASVAAARAMVRVAIRETRRRPILALMAKAPRAGHAKTRLAADLGHSRTAELWAACLTDITATIERVAGTRRWQPTLMVADETDATVLGRLLEWPWPALVQRQPGLAAALVEVFLAAFDRGADRALAVAADNPSLPPDVLETALDALDSHGNAAVVGPTPDGGYHLVGLRWRGLPPGTPAKLRAFARSRLERRLRRVFDAAATRGGSARLTTEDGLARSGWVVEQGAPWPDLDTLDDLRALSRELDGDGRWAPSTAAWVHRHRDVIDDPLNVR